MSWVATGVMVGGSLYSSYESNKQNSKNLAASVDQMNLDAKRNAEQLYTNYKVTSNSLLQQSQEVSKIAGMELTQAKLDGLKNEATTTTALTERGFVGATAGRLSQADSMNTELLSDQIKQKAESNMVDIMNKLTEAKYSYEAGSLSNAITTSNAATQANISYQSNQISTLGAVSKAASAGAQGYSLASSLGSASTSSIANTSQGSSWNQYNSTIRK